MDITEFRLALEGTILGNIFSVNLKNALKFNLIEIDETKQILQELKEKYNKNKILSEMPIKYIREKSLINALTILKLENKCGQKYLSKFNPKLSKNDSYYNVTNEKHILKIWDAKKKQIYLATDGLSKLGEKNRLPMVSGKIGEELYVIEMDNCIWGRVDGANESYRVWISNDNKLWDINDADNVRDKLGLIHIGKGEKIGIIKFNHKTINQLFRPIVSDADTNMRFKKIHGGDQKNKSFREWGKTVDLAKMSYNTANISGSNESVCLPFELPKGAEISFKLLGVTNFNPENEDEDHKKYFEKISQNETPSDILNYLEREIKGKIDEF